MQKLQAGTLPWTLPWPQVESRPAFALVVALHGAAILVLAHLIDSHRVVLRPPLIVEMLIEAEPEAKKPPPPKPLPKERPPEPPPILEEPLPKPVEPPPPEPVLQKPDIAPKPLPVAELPPPKLVAPPQVAPQTVVQRPIVPVELPPRPAAPPEVRERPQPPVRIIQAPVPVEAPRMPEPALQVERDVPEARPVQFAPREPANRPVIDRPPVPAPVNAPVQMAVAEPQPQISVLPEPPPGATTDVVEEITLGAALLRANYLRNPKPLYPAASRRLKEQGTVLLRVFVTAAGQPTQVTLKETSGYERLDHAAQQAVTGWKFVPATRDDKAIDAWVIVPIKFSLRN